MSDIVNLIGYLLLDYRRLIIFSCFVFSVSTVIGQDVRIDKNSLTEYTSDQEIFEMYLDTMDKYVYRDIDKALIANQECDLIIEKGTSLSDSILLNYVIQKVYIEYSKANPLGAYQLISENEYLIENETVSDVQIGNFIYLTSYTFMSIGDLESAQIAFYDAIEHGEAKGDTQFVVKNLHSLAQLFNDTEYCEEAAKCLTDALSYKELIKIRPTTLVLNYLELGESYLCMQDYPKAIEALDLAQEITDSFDLDVLRFDVLVFKGTVFINQDRIESADSIYKLLETSNQKKLDENNAYQMQKFLSELYRKKKMYPEVLRLYDDLIMNSDSNQLDDIIDLNAKAHLVSNEIGNHKEAYNYLLSYNEAKKIKDDDAKRQKTAYLKIKFQSDQKEKDNALLAAKISKNQVEKKTLLSWLLFSGFLLTLLFLAFYQKRRYSRQLEDEVSKRTEKLIESNEQLNKSLEELDEFNRILSHDLTEPLRSIVGFSQLASRDIENIPQAQSYLSMVTKGGKQLGQLIDDVKSYRVADKMCISKTTNVNTIVMIEQLLSEIRCKFPLRKIELNYDTVTDIKCESQIVKIIFTSIIENSLKFNKNEEVRINIEYKLLSKFHTFLITDNGIGMHSKFHGQVFNMFKRLNNREDFKGSGLGLSVAKKLANKIYGDVTVLDSEEGVGTTIKFEFEEK